MMKHRIFLPTMLSLMAIGDVPGCASAEVTWREVATTSIADPLVEMWADQSVTIVPPPPPQPNHRHLHSNISELFGKKAKSFNSTWLLTWDTLLTLILPYSIIFVLAIVGNLLVIITLTMNRSMRSVTNIFLLNLAISDLLLGVFCLPFTLVGVLLRRFIFGAFFCHLLSYLQAVSVAVSVWTLVAMSVERYYAICHPLRSRESRQTRQHAYRILGLVWTLAIITMLPTAIISRLQLIPQSGNYKCREAWPSFVHKEAFTIFLDLCLLVIPLLIMILTYTSIAFSLRQNLQHESQLATTGHQNHEQPKPKRSRFVKLTPCSESQMFEESNTFQSMNENPVSPGRPSSSTMTAGAGNGEDSTNSSKWKSFLRVATSPKIVSTKSSSTSEKSFKGFKYPLRVNSSTHSVSRQRRIVSMLFVVVLEFFVCWTPIFIVDTLSLYRPDVVYGKSRNVSQWIEIDIISACHLLCFCSSCTNPVTYCFMNRRFRRHFMVLFRCRNETTGGEKRLPRATIESECGKPRETCVHYRDGKKQRK